MPAKLSTAVDNNVEDEVKAGFPDVRVVNNTVYNFRQTVPDTSWLGVRSVAGRGRGVRPEGRSFMPPRKNE